MKELFSNIKRKLTRVMLHFDSGVENIHNAFRLYSALYRQIRFNKVLDLCMILLRYSVLVGII